MHSKRHFCKSALGLANFCKFRKAPRCLVLQAGQQNWRREAQRFNCPKNDCREPNDVILATFRSMALRLRKLQKKASYRLGVVSRTTIDQCLSFPFSKICAIMCLCLVKPKTKDCLKNQLYQGFIKSFLLKTSLQKGI